LIDPVAIAHDIVISLIIIAAVWISSRLLIKAITEGVQRTDKQSVPVRRIREAIRLGAVFVAISLILDTTDLGGELTSLTLSGVLALVLSLALQSTLSNVISGIMLYYDGFIRIGDIIEVGGATGKVVRMTLHTCVIETRENNFVVISNQRVIQGPVTNFSRKHYLQEGIEGKQAVSSN
jgi:small-conductance mechanosensitive channel